MTRNSAISYLRIAGYHDDIKSFVRLYVENKISKSVADRAYNEGKKQRVNGVPCKCYQCKDIDKNITI
jgi:hypothetical protein